LSGEHHTLSKEKIETRSWISLMQLMLKTEISICTKIMEENTNNGISSTTKTGRENQPLVNGTETSVSKLTLISTLFLLLDKEDTSTTSQEETS
jgi:hypothetical protein